MAPLKIWDYGLVYMPYFKPIINFNKLQYITSSDSQVSKANHRSLIMILLRDNVANAYNLFHVTSVFVLIESVSRMCVSLDYQPIEVNTDAATESYAIEI